MMDIPLPRTLYDVGPGGRFITSQGGSNALNNNRAIRKYNEAKAQYAPQSLMAEAASKLAYANLMAPQFLAKAMQDPHFMGNLNEEQKAMVKNLVFNAGTGKGTGQNILNQLPVNNQAPSKNPLSILWHKLTDTLVPGQQGNSVANLGQQPMQQQGSGAFNQPGIAPQEQPAPGAYVDENGNPVGEEGESNTPVTPDQAQSLERLDQEGNPTTTPIKMTLKTGQKAIPEGTYAKNGGQYQGVFDEEADAGKIRAKDREELNNTVFNAQTNQATLNQISDILASDAFAQIRQNPLAGHHELAYYALEGSPEQKEMIGQYYTLTGNLIKDASREFAGQFRKGEQTLLNGMKPGPKDTVDTAKGKTEALSTLNRMLTERARVTSKIMADYHIDKLKASEAADKMINASKIRQEVHDRLYPTVTLQDPRNSRMTITLPILEARKRGYKDEE